MKDLIISVAVDGREKYSEVVKGLEQSIIDANWEGDVRIYKEFPDWVTPHNLLPYGFKYDLIKRAVQDKYTKIWWLDSTMRLIKGKDISDLLNSSEDGVIVFDNIGHPVKNFASDTLIANMGMTLQELNGIRQIWGGSTGWDFDNPKCNFIFQALCHQATLGSFNNDETLRVGYKGTRHDQSCLSLICHLYKIPLLEYGVIAATKDVTDQTFIQYGD